MSRGKKGPSSKSILFNPVQILCGRISATNVVSAARLALPRMQVVLAAEAAEQLHPYAYQVSYWSCKSHVSPLCGVFQIIAILVEAGCPPEGDMWHPSRCGFAVCDSFAATDRDEKARV